MIKILFSSVVFLVLTASCTRTSVPSEETNTSNDITDQSSLEISVSDDFPFTVNSSLDDEICLKDYSLEKELSGGVVLKFFIDSTGTVIGLNVVKLKVKENDLDIIDYYHYYDKPVSLDEYPSKTRPYIEAILSEVDGRVKFGEFKNKSINTNLYYSTVLKEFSTNCE